MSRRYSGSLAVALLVVSLTHCGVISRIWSTPAVRPPEITDVTASPNPTYYGQTCGADSPQEFTVTVQIRSRRALQSVTLEWRYRTADGRSVSALQSTPMTPVSGETYQATVQNDPEGVQEVLGGGNGVVAYQVAAVDVRGNSTVCGVWMIGIWACDE